MKNSAGFTALCCMAAAALCFLVAGEVIQVEKYAPNWIIVVCGAVFITFGIYALMIATGGEKRRSRLDRATQWMTGPILFVLFAVITNWIAFGPGTREGSSTISLPFISVSTASNEIAIRFVFGISALFLNFILLLMVYKAIRWSWAWWLHRRGVNKQNYGQ